MGRTDLEVIVKRKVKKEKVFSLIFILILVLYPLRHITWGLDLWDTGYNYANFQYMGLEHMDSMWLFSTYFANAVGNLLTKLPFAGSLAGMNFYTGLSVSLLAVGGYLFCTKKLGIGNFTAFLGELAAVSLCWCPTALLYNYLTYLLFFGCVVLLYEGLVKERPWCLALAGVCLGVNVFVRFSNLPQAAMILAVWAYAVLGGRSKGEKGGRIFGKAFQDTLWCLLGYALALLAFLAYIHLRYGLDAYVSGILRLFAMTDNATDYKASSMLMGLIGVYVENLYWVIRIGVIGAVAMILFQVLSVHPFLQKAGRVVCILLSAAMLGWLYYRGFCSLEFYSYGSMLRPGVLFLMLSMLIAFIRILDKGCPLPEKLVSGMMILVVLLTSIGSNNGVYPSLNNLFVAAPFTLWQCGRFLKNQKPFRIKKLALSRFPLKGLLAAFLAMFLFQSGLFGLCFVFAEATGVQDVSARVENNQVLSGIGMSSQKAAWLGSITDYVEENHLRGREVILYGQIPALSYYLQMPAAFNPWPDLRSYSAEAMEQALKQTRKEAQESGVFPVVILENQFVRYLEGGEEALLELGVDQKRIDEIKEDEKWKLLLEFMEENGYEQTFTNEKFGIWQASRW